MTRHNVPRIAEISKYTLGSRYVVVDALDPAALRTPTQTSSDRSLITTNQFFENFRKVHGKEIGVSVENKLGKSNIIKRRFLVYIA